MHSMLQVVTFKAARDIERGEELTFFYGSNLWFEPAASDKPQQESIEHEHMDDEDMLLSSITL